MGRVKADPYALNVKRYQYDSALVPKKQVLPNPHGPDPHKGGLYMFPSGNVRPVETPLVGVWLTKNEGE